MDTVEREMPAGAGDTTKEFAHLHATSTQYSAELRNTVEHMMAIEPENRPTAADLSATVDQAISRWRETGEGMLWVRKGDRTRSGRVR